MTLQDTASMLSLIADSRHRTVPLNVDAPEIDCASSGSLMNWKNRCLVFAPVANPRARLAIAVPFLLGLIIRRTAESVSVQDAWWVKAGARPPAPSTDGR